ncbi:LuxR C-terminal-related transcriptional regulator [uncultured Muribaculum sp.]|uniref:helix-turn-helix transcriptional regulator n=1 Tax=uncultured Muribaculum sp. TaxID=1918613 RepID=UPI0025DB1DFC|nr:LuxR C-terminal-related transcriptional regulator [uncultured Muribaculum sp.]
MKPLSIAIITQSQVIASGLTCMLQRAKSLPIGDIRTIDTSNIEKDLRSAPCRILMIDPVAAGPAQVTTLRDLLPPATIFVAISACLLPQEVIRAFDYTFSIYDHPAILTDIITKINAETDETDETKALSQREKEVVIGIVKGMSNKEIASEMNVSVNTVMTHRRNITAKLQIHSAAGLTIYAIVSKLVRLDEISTSLPV